MPIVLPTLGGRQLWADRRWRSGWRVQENVLTGHARLLDPADGRHHSGDLDACVARLDALAPPTGADHVVVVLHGLGRSRQSMSKMTGSLAEAGWTVVALDYPSTRRTIEEHAAQVIEVLEHLDGPTRVSFVTHSLGGIVAREVLGSPAFPSGLAPQRLVMCAPPNQGASLARLLAANVGPMFHGVMGPSGRQLAIDRVVPRPTIPFLVIAGRGKSDQLNPLLVGPDDGIVTVEETRLDGMHEHLVVESIHTFVMQHPAARDAAVRFLSGAPITV